MLQILPQKLYSTTSAECPTSNSIGFPFLSLPVRQVQAQQIDLFGLLDARTVNKPIYSCLHTILTFFLFGVIHATMLCYNMFAFKVLPPWVSCWTKMYCVFGICKSLVAWAKELRVENDQNCPLCPSLVTRIGSVLVFFPSLCWCNMIEYFSQLCFEVIVVIKRITYCSTL